LKPTTIGGRLAAFLTVSAALAGSALHAQTVTISPGYTSIGVNATLQYTAVVTGITPPTVTWKVSGITGGNTTYGTITANGLYTAPATIPANGITISALASDKKTSAIVYVNVAPAGPTITSVSPASPANGNYTVTLNGSGFQNGAFVLDGAVRYSSTFVSATAIKVSGWHGGTGPGTFQVMNPGTLWGPVFTVNWVAAGPPPPQVVVPATANVNLGATQQFTSANATSWSATAGAITSNGLYTAPATMPSSNIVTIKAMGPGPTGSATVTLINPNPQLISPATVTLSLGATQQFTSAGATVWSAKFGTITSAGLYTAPAIWPAGGSDTVTVTGPNGNATATVTVTPPSPVITSVGSSNQLPLGIFSATVTGTGFIAQSTVQLNGAAVTATYSAGSLNISGFVGQSGSATLTVSNGSVVSPPFPVQIGVPNAQVSSAAARRFLQQAAFGPTPTDAAHVQTIGFAAWINEQFAMPAISNYSSLAGQSQGGMPNVFLANAVTNPDQLRQKVAFALSQIFVTSFQTVIWDGDMIPYQQMLINDAFTNYPQILNDVTLSPAMGEYLNMANNAVANPAAGTVANENYAREVMQLFSIGTKMLNMDGSVQSNANGPIPTYSQTDVTELARVFTGWTYTPGKNWGAYINSSGPMVPFPSEHDFGSKTLVGGYVVPSGLSPQADLQGALTHLATHPNCAPFISKQLIQHLVKSNPTPAYVQRIATVFAQSGGDMKSVITAILLDTEARANDEGGADLTTDGHMQEPALFIPAIVRAFGGQMTTANYYPNDLARMGQDIYDAPSVFNYYSPSFVAPQSGGLQAPEMQIFNPYTAIVRENEIAALFSQYSNPVASYGPGTTIDLSPLLPLAGNPATLVAAVDLILTRGTMPQGMNTIIQQAVLADNLGNLHRVQTAIYLTLFSNYYNVWH
jgi:uncharacterized protein (DUF1800 family)